MSAIQHYFPSINCTGYCGNITLCISNDYNVYSFGFSKYCQHGFQEQNIFPPKQINGLINIKTITCGASHCVFLDIEGNIYSFGSNSKGRLGIGKDHEEFKQTHIPQKINITSIYQIYSGYNFTLCLTEQGCLYSFGQNNNGQLGLGHTIESNSPQLIPDLNDIDIIECGAHHVICKLYSGRYYSWGHNKYGQLGQNSTDDYSNKPIECINWPNNIGSIKCGLYTSFLLTHSGELYAFGINYCGQLGINDRIIKSLNTPKLINNLPFIKRIECGYDHGICIDENDNLWVFGYNTNGQLGLGDTNHKYKALKHPTLSNIIDISSGGNHTFVKTSDNKIYAFGDNKYSQLGIKTSNELQLTPIQVFKDNEDIWNTFVGKSKQKSARK